MSRWDVGERVEFRRSGRRLVLPAHRHLNPYITTGGKKGSLLGFASAKTIKGEKVKSPGAPHGWKTAILYLAPHTLSGSPTLCPYSTPGCRSVCLYTSGRAQFTPTIPAARMNKSMYWRANKREFIDTLGAEIEAFYRREKTQRPCVRLNGTSDIMWEREAPELFRAFPNLQFYDYTKIPLTYRRPRPDNYYLVYSLAELDVHRRESARVLAAGEANVAIPFDLLPARGKRKGDPLPASFGHALFGRDYTVIDGDEHDLRFLDKPRAGAIVGLRAKGEAQQTARGQGFVVAHNPRRHLSSGRGTTVLNQAGGGMTNTNPALFALLYGQGGS